MNRSIRRWAVISAGMVGALAINATYVQAFWAEDLNNSAGNRRTLLDEYAHQRGPILVRDKAVASSVETEGAFTYLRTYEQPELYAHATGFYSYVYGRSGVENAENGVLSGSDDTLFARRVVDLFAGKTTAGGSVRLTLNPAAQQAAWDGLNGRIGAAVALDPKTGAILAMVSRPSYNPNKLADHDGSVQQKAWNEYANDSRQPMLNRATAQTLPPGSVFKLVTAAAALESGDYDPETIVPGPANYRLPGTVTDLPNWFDGPCGPAGKTTIIHALEQSCNTAFAWLGVQLGQDAMQKQAEKFGFNEQTAPALPAAVSAFPEKTDKAQLALSSIGQFDVRATPLQIAMVAAGIANQGSVMQPYLVDETMAPDLKPLTKTRPKQFKQAISAKTAREITRMMVSVVNRGTGSTVAIPGIDVAGKSGTAQSDPSRPPYAWFAAFAPADDPKVAVAVVVEDSGDNGEISGSRLAAPVAREVMRAVVGR